MLTLYKDSTCDVCLEPYTIEREPYAIACGHVFCLGCLNNLSRPHCPLCRATIRGVDIRRLHVDKTNLPLSTPQSPPAELESADRARQFQTQISRIIREGSTASDWHEMHAELKSWLATQDPGAHADLRATYTLVYRHFIGKQQLADVERQCADLDAQLKKERQESAVWKAELEKKIAAEQEKVLAIEQVNDRLRRERNEWRE
ncbi:hypothetical protein FKP32DRAFT_692164 [Trametes sanguinea]|nr:hypothetical protein FKP32DRAFT_692164 [Trametes sanguinea]